MNSVKIFDFPIENSLEIKTNITPISYGENITYAEIELITGKTHQIRAHVSSIGHPIVGDYKYGINKLNQFYKESISVQSQLLHAYRIKFPFMTNEFHPLSNKEIIAPLPAVFQKVFDLYFK
jgi:23S rRNA pseudouridine955/2504/2580 synthase